LEILLSFEHAPWLKSTAGLEDDNAVFVVNTQKHLRQGAKFRQSVVFEVFVWPARLLAVRGSVIYQ